jgi:hypothetical protein
MGMGAPTGDEGGCDAAARSRLGPGGYVPARSSRFGSGAVVDEAPAPGIGGSPSLLRRSRAALAPGAESIAFSEVDVRKVLLPCLARNGSSRDCCLILRPLRDLGSAEVVQLAAREYRGAEAVVCSEFSREPSRGRIW